MLRTNLKAAALLLAAGLLTVVAAARADDKAPPADPETKPTIPASDDHTDYEAAVARGLRWLALHQAPDGHWSLDEFHKFAHKEPTPDSKTFEDDCTGQATTPNDVAATAFGVLPFLAAGYIHTPPTGKAGADYCKTVKAGLDWLISRQDAAGAFDPKSMYANALATIAVCEARRLTSDPFLKAPTKKALQYIVAAQDPDGGGWRYQPKMPGDLSVTGWQIAALQSGRAAGVDVDKAALKKAQDFLDSCRTKTHGYSYMPAGGPETPTMTAVGMVSQIRLGAGPRDPALAAGVDVLKAAPPGKTGNIYYEYYAAEATAHVGGDARDFWKNGPGGKNGVREVLLGKQEREVESDPKTACLEGSWAPEGAWKQAGGRVMQTSLSLLILEVYYHHLALFPQAAPKEKE